MNKTQVRNIGLDIGSGAAMGVAAAIPGVSGGTIAVMLHVYDRHLDHMNNLRSKQFFKNLLALLPLLLGIILGLIPAVILFDLAFQGFVFGIVCLFAGFILGGMPSLFDEIKNEKVKPLNIVILLITALIALSLGIMSVHLSDKIDIQSAFNLIPDPNETGKVMFDPNGSVAWWIYLALIPVGILGAMALIVPGISGSMILLVLGFYTPLLATIHWIKDILVGDGSWAMFGQLFGIYACFLIGVIIGFFTIVKLMKYVLDKFHVASFYGIIGFVIGSFISLYYNNNIYEYYLHWAGQNDEIKTWMPMGAEIGVGIVLLIGGCIASYLLVVYSRKQQAKKLKESENN